MPLDNIIYWKQFINKWILSNDADNFLRVDYDDFVRNPEKVVSQVLLFMNPDVVVDQEFLRRVLDVSEITDRRHIEHFRYYNQDFFMMLESIVSAELKALNKKPILSDEHTAAKYASLSPTILRMHADLSQKESVIIEQAKNIDYLTSNLEHIESDLKNRIHDMDTILGQKDSVIIEQAKNIDYLTSNLERIESDLRNRIHDLHTIAEMRLDVIEQQKLRIAAVERWRIVSRFRQTFTPKLGVLYHYPPRDVYTPLYYRKSPRSEPELSISIVTPSYNHGEFIERTMDSVLDQNYGKLEYIIQDGGSNDQTVEILKSYGRGLTQWESRSDEGQAHAIQLGFDKTTGEIMAYLNSDDMLMPGALHYIAEYFSSHPEVDVVYGHRVLIDEYDREIGRWVLPSHCDDVLSWADFIPQETLFWRREIWERAGGYIDQNFRFAMDWELILRFREVKAKFVRLPRFLGMFRIHPHQKTSSEMEQIGQREMKQLRKRCLKYEPTQGEILQEYSLLSVEACAA